MSTENQKAKVGRPKGANGKLREFFQGDELDALVTVLRNAAVGGDVAAMRLVLDRIAPAPKSDVFDFRDLLPPGFVWSQPDALEVLADIVVAQYYGGTLSGEHALQAFAIIDARRKVADTSENAKAIGKIQAALGMK